MRRNQRLVLMLVHPYIQGVTEPIERILNSDDVNFAQKPCQTLRHILAKPKDLVAKEQRTDANYSILCNDCDQEQIGQTKRQFGRYTYEKAFKSSLLLQK